MYAQYFLWALLGLCFMNGVLTAIVPGLDAARMNALMSPPGQGNPLAAKDTIGQFPGLSNTVYSSSSFPGQMSPDNVFSSSNFPGQLPPGYVYTRRVRTSMPNIAYPTYPTYPTGSYYRRRTFNNNQGQFPWMWYAMSEM
ncbi:uncharacterized protein LOC127730532 isoform X1 [Mytilus californianus]|uniref:uncharacterized protein LOC127730532 isoform X1 n=1 Tax=Mytilus californianus TaxID=6549 RepID=UPI002245D595|nr:uncharacterized protein LOC127730532 isoform X1 [Mytilus californianus]